jgi:lipopolysaccharide exporter
MAATTAVPGGRATRGRRRLPPASPARAVPLASSVRKGAVWSVASTIALRFGTIASTAVVAHILDRSDFGVFAVALTALMIVLSFGELGVASCLVRADLDIDALAPTMVTVSLVSGGALAIALAEYAVPIATALGSAAAAGPVRVMAISAVLGGFFAVPNAQLSRDFRQDRLFMANLVAFVPATAVLLVMAQAGSGAMAFAWSRIAGQLVAGGIQCAAVARRYRPGIARRALRTLLRFGLPLGGANFVGYVLLNVDYAFVGHLMGATALGVYVIGFNVASWPVTLLASMIGSVSMPAISRVKHDAATLRNAITGGMRALCLVVAPICALSATFARQLISCVYGPRWAAAAGVLSVLAIYGGISVICQLFSNIVSGLGRSRSLLAVQLIWLAALIPAMALGVRRAGIDGAAAAHVMVITPIVLPCYVAVLLRSTDVRLTDLLRPLMLPVLVAGGAAVVAARAAALLAGPLPQLVTGLSVGALLYGVVLAPQLTGLVSREQAARLRLDRVASGYRSAGRAIGLVPPARREVPQARPARPIRAATCGASVNGMAVEVKELTPRLVEQTLELRASELRALLAVRSPGSHYVPRHAGAGRRSPLIVGR